MAPAQASMRIFAAMHVAGHHQNGHLLATKLKRAKGFLCFDGTFKSSYGFYGWFGYAKIIQNRSKSFFFSMGNNWGQ